jgi:hypothetical protein
VYVAQKFGQIVRKDNLYTVCLSLTNGSEGKIRWSVQISTKNLVNFAKKIIRIYKIIINTDLLPPVAAMHP